MFTDMADDIFDPQPNLRTSGNNGSGWRVLALVRAAVAGSPPCNRVLQTKFYWISPTVLQGRHCSSHRPHQGADSERLQD